METGQVKATVSVGPDSVSSTRSGRDAEDCEIAPRSSEIPGANQFSASDRARFYEKTSPAESGCLLWTAGVTTAGYGKFSLHGKTISAHRAAWMLTHGEVLSSDQFVLHSCDTRLCVEITHLRIGTHEENMADRKARGHYNTSRGANNPFARFSDEDVAHIRSMIGRGVDFGDIAGMFECTRGYVRLIAEGKLRSKPTTVPSQHVLANLEQKTKAQARRTRIVEITATIHPEDEIEGEEWRQTRFDGYWVSSLGRVRGRTKTVLKPYITVAGYAVVHCGRSNPKGVHALVCEAWHGPPPAPGMHAAHYNGNPLDNRADNLRWATPLENIGRDRLRHGTVPRGENHANAKLTQEKARAIRAQLPGPRGTIARLAREYGVTKTVITNIRDNVTWRA
ncbi:HNH endonuclease [Arthrobacter sp. NamB2]|uniref:HNH endonuclease signature motif containing protein n=1 Tax=Arthrobacter sp. NamB2 TaxID=2576035 RepID=UPI001CB8F38A